MIGCVRAPQLMLIVWVFLSQFVPCTIGLQGGLPFRKSPTMTLRPISSHRTKGNAYDNKHMCTPQNSLNSLICLNLKSESNFQPSYKLSTSRTAASTTVLFQQATKQAKDNVKEKNSRKTVVVGDKRKEVAVFAPWRSTSMQSWKFTDDGASLAAMESMQVSLNRLSQVFSVSATNIAAQMLIAYGTVFQVTRTVATESFQIAKATIMQYWWTFPMILCFVPLISHSLFQHTALTPDFWKMVNMQYIAESPDALMVIGCFLGSNIAYIIAALFLLIRYPSRILPRGIGLWILSAGVISTIFHSVQAIGDTIIAEALCYVDHGIAATAILYFWNVCGKPPPESKKFWLLAISGLVALCCPLKPGYAWLHSTWHFLSAGAAVVWALEGKLRRKQRIFQLIRQKQHATNQQKRKSSVFLSTTI